MTNIQSLAVLPLFLCGLFACESQPAAVAPSQSRAAASPAAPAQPVSPAQASSDVPDARTAELADAARRARDWQVTGVAQGDVLNVRSKPGADQPIVAKLAPDATGIELRDAVDVVDGALWQLIATAEGTGWVNAKFLRPPQREPVVKGTRNATTDAAAQQVASALREQDYQRLSKLVGPRGVLVSTDGYVDDADPVLDAKQIAGAKTDRKVVLWGTSDGEGKPIKMTIAQRLQEIAGSTALLTPDIVGFDVPVGSGNTVNNLSERFPGASVLEYHFQGTPYHDMDWSSVRFVFDTAHEDGPILLAIVEDQWTI